VNTNHYSGKERRSSLGQQVRRRLEQDVEQLKILFSTLHHAHTQHLPEGSCRALEKACLKLGEQLQKEGLAEHRIVEIRREAFS